MRLLDEDGKGESQGMVMASEQGKIRKTVPQQTGCDTARHDVFGVLHTNDHGICIIAVTLTKFKALLQMVGLLRAPLRQGGKE
jgi:hypothetical protein